MNKPSPRAMSINAIIYWTIAYSIGGGMLLAGIYWTMQAAVMGTLFGGVPL